jgi:hypothetical protein
MADLNIVNVSTINGRTTGANLILTSSDIVNNAFGQSKTFKLNNIMLSSYSANTVNVAIDFVDYSKSNTAFPLVYQLNVPSKATIEVLSRPVYLEEGDKLTARSFSEANNVVMVVSYEELS